MRLTRSAATVAVLTALIVGSNLALSDFPNVKLDAAVIFMTTIIFGAYAGASVAVLSELIWSQVSPWGASGAYLLPFLISAELLYVVAGLLARRALRGRWDTVRGSSALFAGLLVIFTFIWDVWTNLGTAILATNLSPGAILFVEFNPFTLAFSLTHELSNLVLGAAFVPATLILLPKVAKGLVQDAIR
ncbi:MAG: hypothetical protein ACLQEQ_03250 [Nitrososphaerales archaeon]